MDKWSDKGLASSGKPRVDYCQGDITQMARTPRWVLNMHCAVTTQGGIYTKENNLLLWSMNSLSITQVPKALSRNHRGCSLLPDFFHTALTNIFQRFTDTRTKNWHEDDSSRSRTSSKS